MSVVVERELDAPRVKVKPQVLVFVPAFRGNLSATLFETSHALMSRFMQSGISASISTYSWPDIAELRNMILSVWYDVMKSSTHLLFVDDDMGFPPQLIMDMIEFDEPVVGAIYPMRTTPRKWCGSGIESPEFRQGFINVEGVGAGCLLIRRDAVTKLIEHFPDLIGDYMVLEDMKAAGGYRTLQFFDPIRTPLGKVSEDISFCRRWRETGADVWAATSYPIHHVGPWVFSGCFAQERNEEAKQKAAADGKGAA